MSTILRWFDRLVLGVIFLCIAGFVTFAFAQVFCRFVLNDSLTWSEELCRYLFVWMVFLGAGVGILHRRHIMIDFIPNKIPDGARKYYISVLNLIILVFTVLLMKYGYAFALRGMRQNSPAMQIPFGYIYSGIVIGGAVMFINTLRVILSDLFTIPVVEKPEPAPELEMTQEEFNRLLGIDSGSGPDGGKEKRDA